MFDSNRRRNSYGQSSSSINNSNSSNRSSSGSSNTANQHMYLAAENSHELRATQIPITRPLELLSVRARLQKRNTHSRIALPNDMQLPQWLSQSSHPQPPDEVPIRADAFVGYVRRQAESSPRSSEAPATQPESPADSGWQLVYEPPQQSPLIRSTLAGISNHIRDELGGSMFPSIDDEAGGPASSQISSSLDELYSPSPSSLLSISSDSAELASGADQTPHVNTDHLPHAEHVNGQLGAGIAGNPASNGSDLLSKRKRLKDAPVQQARGNSENTGDKAVSSCPETSCYDVDTEQRSAAEYQQQELEELREKVAALNAEVLVQKKELEAANAQSSRIVSALQCSVCLDTFNRPHSLGCGHIFCQECLMQWLKQSKKCPACRKNVRHRPAISFVVQDIIGQVSSCSGSSESNLDYSLGRNPWDSMFPKHWPLGDTMEFVRCERCRSWMMPGQPCTYCEYSVQELQLDSNGELGPLSQMDRYQMRLVGQVNEIARSIERLRDNDFHGTMPSSHGLAGGNRRASLPRDRLRRDQRVLRRADRRRIAQSPPESLFDPSDLLGDIGTRQQPIRWLPSYDDLANDTDLQDASSSAFVRQNNGADSTARQERDNGLGRMHDWYNSRNRTQASEASGASTRRYVTSDDVRSSNTRITRLRRTFNRPMASGASTTSRNPIRISRIIGHGADATNSATPTMRSNNNNNNNNNNSGSGSSTSTSSAGGSSRNNNSSNGNTMTTARSARPWISRALTGHSFDGPSQESRTVRSIPGSLAIESVETSFISGADMSPSPVEVSRDFAYFGNISLREEYLSSTEMLNDSSDILLRPYQSGQLEPLRGRVAAAAASRPQPQPLPFVHAESTLDEVDREFMEVEREFAEIEASVNRTLSSYGRSNDDLF